MGPQVTCFTGKPHRLGLSRKVESHIRVANSMNPCVISKLNWPSCDLKTAHINYLRIGIFLFPMISLYKTLLKPLLIMLQFVLQFAFPLEVPCLIQVTDGVGHSHTLFLMSHQPWVFCVFHTLTSCFSWRNVKWGPTLSVWHMPVCRHPQSQLHVPFRWPWALFYSWLKHEKVSTPLACGDWQSIHMSGSQKRAQLSGNDKRQI